MGKGKGYVLPAGDAYTEELRCALVFYPARDEYLYALMGSLRFLGMWLAWERDELKRGKDAAAAWRLAIEQTEACMGMCDDLLERLDSLPRLEQLMEQLLAAQCCAPALVSDTVTTDLTIGGDPPATWGDGVVVSDYEHWESLLCGAAHAYVDLLISDAEWLASLTGAVVIGVGLIAALLGALSGAGLILAIGYGTLTSVSAGLLASILAGDHVGVPAALEDARADIVCAIVHGGAAQLSAAVEEAVGALAWAALYSWVDYDSAWATMAAGGNAAGTLPASTRSDCDCALVPPAGMRWETSYPDQIWWSSFVPGNGATVTDNGAEKILSMPTASDAAGSKCTVGIGNSGTRRYAIVFEIVRNGTIAEDYIRTTACDCPEGIVYADFTTYGDPLEATAQAWLDARGWTRYSPTLHNWSVAMPNMRFWRKSACTCSQLTLRLVGALVKDI